MHNVLLIQGPQSLSCDVLVIGTGAGGASVAAMLAKNGIDVLMVEEGAFIPADSAPLSLSESMSKMWRGGGLTATLGIPPIAFAEGRCVGGGTEINSAIFQAAPDEVLSNWEKANRIADFSPQSLAPYLRQAAMAVNASLTRGAPGAPTDILDRGARSLGWKVAPLERARHESPITRHRLSGFATGVKQSMTATLIPDALAHGAKLIARCRIEKLVKKGSRIVSILAQAIDQEGRSHRVTISASTLFLCAGTTQTPALLQRSRIGRHVGQDFQVHPTVRVMAEFGDRVDAHLHHLPLVAITEFMPDLRFGGSVFSLATFGLMLAEDWAKRGDRLKAYANHAIYYAMIRPDGVGQVRSIPGLAEPIITYQLTDRDMRQLGKGLFLLAKALFAAGATCVIPSIRGHAGWKDVGDLERNPPDVLPFGRTAIMTIHLFGSCAMGGDPDSYSVDSFGRLFGIDNLIIADGSVLPGAPGVNPQATIMALAFRFTDAYIAGRK